MWDRRYASKQANVRLRLSVKFDWNLTSRAEQLIRIIFVVSFTRKKSARWSSAKTRRRGIDKRNREIKMFFFRMQSSTVLVARFKVNLRTESENPLNSNLKVITSFCAQESRVWLCVCTSHEGYKFYQTTYNVLHRTATTNWVIFDEIFIVLDSRPRTHNILSKRRKNSRLHTHSRTPACMLSIVHPNHMLATCAHMHMCTRGNTSDSLSFHFIAYESAHVGKTFPVHTHTHTCIHCFTCGDASCSNNTKRREVATTKSRHTNTRCCCCCCYSACTGNS